jgi:hypothetical protein
MRLRSLIAALTFVGLATSCQGAEPASEFELQEVEDSVRVALEAENEKDVDTFLDYWTDEGLAQYDVGSRADLQAGRVASFGDQPILISEFTNTKIVGDNSTTTVDAVQGEHRVAWPLSRVRFTLVKRDSGWLINGFKFIGGTPPPDGTDVIDIEARDYEFRLEQDEVSRRVAFEFSNTGKEAHEITMFKGPDDVTLDRAREDLKDVQGHELDKAPEGYEADHVAFAEPDQSINATFARPFARGAYVLACYIPRGGFNEQGESDPDAQTHFELGMVAILGVR